MCCFKLLAVEIIHKEIVDPIWQPHMYFLNSPYISDITPYTNIKKHTNNLKLMLIQKNIM